MKFEIKRDLTNKVFSTQVICAEYGTESMTAEEEKTLIEDFGPVTVQVGGEFKGEVKVGEKGAITVTKAEGDLKGKDVVSFVLNANNIELKEKLSIPYAADANKIDSTEKLTAEQISEARCKIFEMCTKERITKTLEAFKKQQTTFEKEKLEDFYA